MPLDVDGALMRPASSSSSWLIIFTVILRPYYTNNQLKTHHQH